MDSEKVQDTPQAAAAPTPPPPAGAQLTLEHYNKLYAENLRALGEISRLKAETEQLKAEHAAALQAQQDRLSTLEELEKERDGLKSRSDKYTEYVMERLKSEFESLDEMIAEDFSIDDFAEDPISGFGAIEKRRSDIEKLRAKLEGDSTKGNNDALQGAPKAGQPQQPGAPALVTREDFQKYYAEKIAKPKPVLKPV